MQNRYEGEKSVTKEGAGKRSTALRNLRSWGVNGVKSWMVKSGGKADVE